MKYLKREKYFHFNPIASPAVGIAAKGVSKALSATIDGDATGLKLGYSGRC